MIEHIARKELRETLRDGRFRVIALVVLALSVASVAAGWKHASDVHAQHEEARRATRAQWLGQPEKNPHSAAHYGIYAFKPKHRLSLLDTGIDPYVGVAAWLEAHKQNEFRYRPAEDRTDVQRFGDLTAAEALLTLLPLFIVLVTFNAFAGEREQGTLRHLLSLGVRPATLMTGKAAGLALALALVLGPATLAGVIALALTPQFGALAHDAARAALLAGVYVAYFATLMAIGLGVSARASSSRVALLVLLAFWFGNSLIAPRVASDVAAALHPAPSAVMFRTAMETDLSDTSAVQRRLEQRRQDVLRRFDVASVEAAPINFSGISLQEGEEHANEVFDEHFGRLFATFERQNVVRTLVGVCAPLLPVRALSMALAGTDFAHHRAFVEAAEQHRRSMQRVMNDDIAQHSRPGQVYLAGADLWRKVPEFTYQTPGLAWVLRRNVVSLALLCAWLTASVAFAVTGIRRMAGETRA